MNQIKIGKFIAYLRKEKQLTQLELAQRLGITDRAISKWENGRGLPDLSLIKPLCDELDITVNELLCGERIAAEQIGVKTEENILNTLKFSKKKINKVKAILLAALLSVFLFFIILFTMFGIDVSRMRNNLPVVFSTWGHSYTPPINIQDNLIENAVYEYVMKHDDSEPKYYKDEKAFVSINTYLIEETEKETKFNLYTWVVGEKYHLENGQLEKGSGYSIPHKFTVERHGEEYVVVDSRRPRDGGYYSEDMKNIFPADVRQNMKDFYNDGTSERLLADIQKQVKLYFHID